MRLILVIFILVANLTFSQQISPFNEIKVDVKNVNDYTFLVGGHFHGSSTNISGFPASSLLANIDKINADSSAFLMSTGDLFLDVTTNIPNYQKSLFNKLKLPLFNAVGNHDISGDIYKNKFGDTFDWFVIGSEIYLLLDCEKNDGSISGEQLIAFKSVLDLISKNATIKNIFIFSHRPIWSENDTKLKNIFVDNTQSTLGNNFETDVLPLLNKASKNHKIFWFSGSLGGNAPASFFYYNAKKNLTYIQTAIRDLPRDGILKVHVNNSKISFETISFSNSKMPKLEDCGLNLWKNASSTQPFNTRLVPLYIKQTIFHRYFWYGLLSGVIFLFLISKLIKKFKRK